MNAIPCVGGCTIDSEHLSTCLGIRSTSRGAIPCAGCLPRPAEEGLLCYSCALKVDETWEVLVDLVTHMRSVERGPADDMPVRGAPGSRVIIPPSWQEADATWTTLHAAAAAATVEFDGLQEPELLGTTTVQAFGSQDSIETVRENVERFVEFMRSVEGHSRTRTARALLRLVRRVQQALRAFPMKERAHLVEHIWCRSCQSMTLQWEPPLNYRDHILVRCTNPDCSETFDPALIEVDLRQLREQMEQLREAVA